MVNFTLAKTSSEWLPDINSYKMTVEITAAVEAPKEIFVIKRTTNYVNDQFDDVFAAVATPAQIEDFPVSIPRPNSSYYRTNKVTLVVRTAESMQAIFDSMLYEVNKLAVDLDALHNGLLTTATYQISGAITTLNSIHIGSSSSSTIPSVYNDGTP